MGPQPVEQVSQAPPACARAPTDEPAQPDLLDFSLPLSFLFPDKKLNVAWKHGDPPIFFFGQ
jgi:hypothetical protein